MTDLNPDNSENYPGNVTVDTNAGDDAKPGLGVDEHTDETPAAPEE